jgi:hypothetical protein
MNEIEKIGKDFFSRKNDDNVHTPFSMTDQLLENEYFDYEKIVADPACGKNAISDILSDLFISNNIIKSDIIYGVTNDSVYKETRLLKRLDSVKKMTDYPCLREDGKYPAGMYHFCWFIFENKNYLSKIPGVKIPDYPEIRMINNNEYILRSDDFNRGSTL